MSLPQAARRKAAADKEITSLKKHGVDELVPASSVSPGQKVVGSRWVNKIKADDLFKSCLIVLGWAQVPGIDCGGTFASVCRLQSARAMLAIAAELVYEVLILDVQTAFLNADVEDEVYVEMAPGCETYDKSGVPFVMKLKKSLYALRQRSKNWVGNMDNHLSNIDFRSLRSDPCVYMFEDMTGSAVLTLYVNSISLLGNIKKLLGKLIKQLMDCFERTDLRDVLKVLGMNVARDRENVTITIDQKDYTEDILARNGMTTCNATFTLGVGAGISFDKPADRLLDEQEKQRYQPIVGARMYLAQVSRYDVLYAVNQLARAMSKPSKAHTGVAKHVLQYLARSVNFPVTYKRGIFKLRGNPDNGMSTSSFIVMLANGPISSSVGLQSLTAQSIMETELVAAATAMKESFFYRNLMMELGFTEEFRSVPVYIDGILALHVAGNRTFSPKAKHIRFVKTEQQPPIWERNMLKSAVTDSSSSSPMSSEPELAFSLPVVFVQYYSV